VVALTKLGSAGRLHGARAGPVQICFARDRQGGYALAVVGVEQAPRINPGGGWNVRPDEHPEPTQPSATRRDFLQVTGLAACLGAAVPAADAAAQPSAKADPLLPTVKLGKHQLTRLIIGGNPIYGYSHFNKLLSQ